jgi:hypothetical protein
MSYITGVGFSSFGKRDGSVSIDLTSQAAALTLGDRVSVLFVQFAGRLVPCFAKASPRDKTGRWR